MRPMTNVVLPKNVERCFSIWYRGMRTSVSDLLNFQVYRQSQQVLFIRLEIVLRFGMKQMFLALKGHSLQKIE